MDALSKTSSLFPLFSVIASLMPILALQCHPGLCGQFLLLDTCIASGLGDAIYCKNETLYLAILSGSYKVLKLDYSKRLLVLEIPLTTIKAAAITTHWGI
ncbi:hypothetical protein O6H91_20G048400 [Diphasiastrum complanatum]|uniref:Uncharacterized protein n=1 Tax=Diphasiastrum complanatum TaxID=34168 RepID=A0ACC2AQ42_DIPCM|nr:hypothetical protein O6H91_Y173800 [Diphasiastrum complanatum]KAJ7519648.1 hypothetical protein O6H91_20G048400 [Diphasiastrum complanatum]